MLDFKTYTELLALYSEYGMICDSDEWEKWPDFFTEDGKYRLQPRENFEQSLPLCLLALESKAMIKDRVYGVKETLYHDPYYQRHIVSIPRILQVKEKDGELTIQSEANYVVLRTKYDGQSSVFNTGYYHDQIKYEDGKLKFQTRLCIYDTEMIDNSLIYPI